MATINTAQTRLKKVYDDKLKAELVKTLGLSNYLEAPKLMKVSVSVGLGKSKEDKRMFEVASNTLAKITGQHPVQSIARKSIASFKLREGQPIGLRVTLRGKKMYEFVDRLINIVLPRVRDFHGVSNSSFDTKGNYTLGFVDQSIFPELSFEETALAHGLQITLVIDSKSPEHSKALIEGLGMPFMKMETKE